MNGIFILLTYVTRHRSCTERIAILCFFNLTPYPSNSRLYGTVSFHSDETRLTYNYIEVFQSNFPYGKIVLLTNQNHYILKLREKCRNTKFFLVLIFQYSDWIRSKSPYSVQMQKNTNQKKRSIWALFTQCKICWKWQSVV